ncbi:MAG: transcriptional repressor [Chloroflexi bacterium]|nr:MAG: transcriptional repressor [Chloroflexota bacterium]
MRINRNHSKKERPSTPQRQLLLDILREAKGHLDARELYRRAIEKDPRIGLATVYRNLRLFKELGLVEERRLDEAHCYYEIKGTTEHYHMVCRACGRVIEFESPLVSKLVAEVQRNSDFDVIRAVLYLEGYCRKCEDGEKVQ